MKTELSLRWKITLIFFAIAIVYLISPIDIFPLSLIDDAAFFALAFVLWILLVLIDTPKKNRKKKEVENQ